jgi:hypothetical protein
MWCRLSVVDPFFVNSVPSTLNFQGLPLLVRQFDEMNVMSIMFEFQNCDASGFEPRS